MRLADDELKELRRRDDISGQQLEELEQNYDSMAAMLEEREVIDSVLVHKLTLNIVSTCNTVRLSYFHGDRLV